MAAQFSELSNLRHSRQLLIILMFSLVTIVAWVSISLITSQKKTTISAELQALALPLTPSLNLEVLSDIESKRMYSANELASFPIYVLTEKEDRRSNSPAQPSLTPTPPPGGNLNSLLPAPTPASTGTPSATVTTPPPASGSGVVENL